MFVREQGTIPWEKLTPDLLSEPSFALSDLKQNTPYQARVTATSAKGESQPSEPSDVFQVKPATSSAVDEGKTEEDLPTPQQRKPSQTESAEAGKNAQD